MSKFKLKIKAALPAVQSAVVTLYSVNGTLQYKGQEKVQKALSGANTVIRTLKAVL